MKITTEDVYIDSSKDINHSLLEELVNFDIYLQKSASHEFLFDNMYKLEEELLEHGVSKRLLEAIKEGLKYNHWDNAVLEFGLAREQSINFYLGPMCAMEGKEFKDGIILTKQTSNSSKIVSKVESLCHELGNRLFGFPCDFHDRHIEFYDLLFSSGPFSDSNGKYIALFTPFYLGYWKDSNKQFQHKRSILFHNLVKMRFSTLTLPVAKANMRINNITPTFIDASKQDIDDALTLWLTLHELIHGSGPIPLFNSSVQKLPLGLKYAGIEEMRTDMTVWLLLDICQDLFGNIAKLAQEIIVAERIFRSARAGLWANPTQGWIQKSSDGEQGALWLALLLQHNAIESNTDFINIDYEKTKETLQYILSEVYDIESNALKSENGQQELLDYADKLRERMFRNLDGVLIYPKESLNFLKRIENQPTHVALNYR
ncbi:hypothetical protein COE50_25365 [Bacillus anthracis]|uniref:hypothetical protein n=1 Tax=Bacillus tropicus TaxID=2026188 RepID=UPI000BF80072|nr:hypothetical protein COK10_22610 [Bacillus anthracis]PGZ27910.1 hypothetical protein COE50_25365 [Bacillus anthracis]